MLDVGKPPGDIAAMPEHARAAATSEPSWLRPAVDYGPLAAFFVAYLVGGLMVATGVVIAASLAAVVLSRLVARRWPMMAMITAGVVAVFGGLTLWLADETFIKMKPTIVQGLIALILFGGLVFGRPLLRPLLGPMLPPMEEGAWRGLTLRYASFFLAMAGLNELVWRTQSTDFWVTFKVFGIILLTLAFALSQLPFLARHRLDTVTGED
jgi:intracellular septation protein